MNWVTITEADLATVLDGDELRTYRQRATSPKGVDPVASLIENAVQEARDRIRANQDNKVLAAGSTVPPGMVARVLIIIRQRVLTICKVKVGEDRLKEYESAEAYFRDVAAGRVVVPTPDDAAPEVTPTRPTARYNPPPARPAF